MALLYGSQCPSSPEQQHLLYQVLSAKWELALSSDLKCCPWHAGQGRKLLGAVGHREKSFSREMLAAEPPAANSGASESYLQSSGQALWGQNQHADGQVA